MFVLWVRSEIKSINLSIATGELVVFESRIISIRTPNAAQDIIHLNGGMRDPRRFRHIPIAPLGRVEVSRIRRIRSPLERGCVLV
jgi:hypothetical protein